MSSQDVQDFIENDPQAKFDETAGNEEFDAQKPVAATAQSHDYELRDSSKRSQDSGDYVEKEEDDIPEVEPSNLK